MLLDIGGQILQDEQVGLGEVCVKHQQAIRQSVLGRARWLWTRRAERGSHDTSQTDQATHSLLNQLTVRR